MSGYGPLQTFRKQDPAGSPFTPGSAANGNSIDALGRVVIGNNVGAAGSPGQLLNTREILTNGFFIALVGGLLPTDPITQLDSGFIGVLTNAGNSSSVLSGGALGLSDVGAGGSTIVMDNGIPLSTEMRYRADLWTIGAQSVPMVQLYLATGNLVVSQTLNDNGQKLQVDGNISMLVVAANLDFPLTAPFTSSDLTVAVTNAAVGDMVVVGFDPAGLDANSCYTGFVDSAGSVTVRFNNYSAAAIDPAARDFNVSIFKPL
jgi:hypothetical protein